MHFYLYACVVFFVSLRVTVVKQDASPVNTVRVCFAVGVTVHRQLVKSLCVVIYYSLAHLAVQQ